MRLLNSWATPPASRPTASSFCASRSRVWLSASAASARLRAVMSRVTLRMPVGRPLSSRTQVKVDSTHTVDPSLHGCSSSRRRNEFGGVWPACSTAITSTKAWFTTSCECGVRRSAGPWRRHSSGV